MNLNQRKFAKEYVKNGGNGKAAAIAAGYSPKSAKGIASELINKNLNVQTYLYRLMDKRGLTDDKLLSELSQDIKTCNDGIKDAKKVISARVIVKSDDPTVKLEQANSRTDDFIEVEDHHARIGYLREKQSRLETAFKLRGHLKNTDETPGPKSITVIYGHNVAAQTVVKVTQDNGDNGS